MKKSIIDILICVPLMVVGSYLTSIGYSLFVQFSVCLAISIYLFIIPSHRSIILFCSLGVFNSSHYLFISGLNLNNEPYYYKVVKDIFLFGFFLNLFFKNNARKSSCYKYLYVKSWPLLLFMVFVFVHNLMFLPSGDFIASAVSVRYLIIYPLIAFLSVGAFKLIDHIEDFFKILCILGFIVCIIGFVEILTVHHTYYSNYINLGFIHQRMISTLLNPNNCALFLLIPIIFLFMRLMSKSGSVFVNFIVFITLVFGLFLTFSRSGLLILCVAIIWLSLYYKSIRVLALSSIMAICGIAMVVVTTLSRPQMQNANTVDLSRSFAGRLLFGLLDSISKFWNESGGLQLITGIGFGSSKMVVTDNMYTYILLGGGILSLLFFVIALTTILGQSVMAIRNSSPRDSGLLITLSAILLMNIVHMFSAVTAKLFPISLFLWVFVGCMWSIKYGQDIEYEHIETVSTGRTEYPNQL